MDYLLERIKAGRSNTAIVRFGASIADALNDDELVTIRLLTTQDVLESTLAADKIFADSGVAVSLQNIKTYEAEKETQHLYRACTDSEGKPLAPNITKFRQLLTVEDKEYLIDEYNKLAEAANPAIDKMSDADFDALVEAVKKNPSTVSSVSSTNTLRRLVLSLAFQLAISQTDNGHTSQ